MTLPRTSSRFRVIRSRWLFLVTLCLHFSAFIFRPILILIHTNVKYDTILDKIEVERSRAKVKVTVAIFISRGRSPGRAIVLPPALASA